MIDDEFRINLIEINTNPCLETSCPVLSKIIPRMLDNAFKISIDPIFPPPELNFKRGSKSISTNLFTLIFDDQLEKPYFLKPKPGTTETSPFLCDFCDKIFNLTSKGS